jgi:hypothetical protein
VPLLLTLSVILLTSDTSEASTQTVKVAQYNLSFALPSHWQQVALNGSDISGILDLVAKADPSMKHSLSTEVKQAAKEGIKIFAFGPIVDHFASNLNVIVEPQPSGPSTPGYFDQLGVEVKLNLANAGMKKISTSTVRWAQGEVLQATYSLHLVSPVIVVKGIQDYVWHKGRVFIVTFSSAKLSSDAAAAHLVGRSWHWGLTV